MENNSWVLNPEVREALLSERILIIRDIHNYVLLFVRNRFLIYFILAYILASNYTFTLASENLQAFFSSFFYLRRRRVDD